MRITSLVVLFCVLAQNASALASSSAMFRADPRHSGVYDSVGVTRTPSVKWRYHTKGFVVSTAAVDATTVYVGSTDGSMYALDRATGRLQWRFATKSRVVSSPALAGGLVYFGSYDGYFYALHAATGAVAWKFQTGGERRFEGTHLHGSLPKAETMPDPFDVYLSSPVVSRGDVFFGSGDGNVYALDARSGSLRWKFTTGDVVHASPAIDDNTVFVGSWDSYFYALDAASGTVRWRFKTGIDPDIHNQVGIQSSAAIANGIVYFGCRDSHLYALDERTGVQRWAYPTSGSWVVASPAVRGNAVYFATSDSGLLLALDASSGATIFSLSFQSWPTFSSPALAGDMLYVGSNAGKLRAIDVTTHAVAWTWQTDAARHNGPALTQASGEPNYAAAFASNFYDDLVAGNLKMMSVGAILSSPVVLDGVIYVGSTDGNVYALSD